MCTLSISRHWQCLDQKRIKLPLLHLFLGIWYCLTFNQTYGVWKNMSKYTWSLKIVLSVNNQSTSAKPTVHCSLLQWLCCSHFVHIFNSWFLLTCLHLSDGLLSIFCTHSRYKTCGVTLHTLKIILIFFWGFCCLPGVCGTYTYCLCKPVITLWSGMLIVHYIRLGLPSNFSLNLFVTLYQMCIYCINNRAG